MSVESGHQKRWCDDRGEVQEQEVVIVHYFGEEAFHSVRWLRPVPAEKREQSHKGSSYPAHPDDGCNNTIVTMRIVFSSRVHQVHEVLLIAYLCREVRNRIKPEKWHVSKIVHYGSSSLPGFAFI